MANDRLRTALLAAGLTADDLAAKVQVDRKTVDRWIANEDRQPHRSTRSIVAAALGVHQGDLWPDQSANAGVDSGELVRLYPSRSAIPGHQWHSLIANTAVQMDVLVFSGAFLVEQYDLVPTIARKSAEGVRFRILVGDERQATVIQRAHDEGTPGGLEGRIQLMRRYLSDVVHLSNVEVRTHGTILYNSIYRFDDEMLINGHAHGALAGQSPVMHLKRQESGGSMWQHYMKSFERVWNSGASEGVPQ